MSVNSFSGQPAIPASYGFTAGKNAIINGDFRINQRSFTSITTNGVYGFDRWKSQVGSPGTSTYTPQTFTPGTAPVAGYEGSTFAQIISASQSGSGDYSGFSQSIESVRTFANQTVTVSFWAKAASGTPNVGITIEQNFGSGGSSPTYTSAAPVAITTSWVRYSVTINVPSISGKTIGGADNFLGVYILNSTNTTLVGIGFSNTGLQNGTFQYWGVQVEAGSTATSFQTATGTIQGELAACQRYYFRTNYTTGTEGAEAGSVFGHGFIYSSTSVYPAVQHPVVMRVKPTSMDFSNLRYEDWTGTTGSLSAATINNTNTLMTRIVGTVSGATANRYCQLQASASNGYIGFSAEL